MQTIKGSGQYEVPSEVGTVKEWAAYLVSERNAVENNTYLKSRNLENVPENGFIVVDVPVRGTPRIFNFRNDRELVAAADETGVKWRSEKLHPMQAIGAAVSALPDRQRVGSYASWGDVVKDAIKPENAHGREEFLQQVHRMSEGRGASETVTQTAAARN